MGKKCDISDFERSMVVGAREKLLIYWDFHEQLSPGFTENGEKKKYPVSGGSLGENAL